MSLSKKLSDLQVDLERASTISNKLAQQDIYMSTFFHLSNDLLCIAGHDGFFKVVNQTWTDVLGYSNKELTTKQWLEFVHPDDIEKTKEAAELLKTQPLYNFTNRYLSKNGQYVTLSWNAKQSLDGTIYACAREI